VKHRELLAAISEIEPVRVQGTFERHSSLRWEELAASAAGGRWGARRAYEVLYLGRPRDSVVVEAYRHLVDDELDDSQALAAAVLERRIITCEVDVPDVLDLRAPAAQTGVALGQQQLSSEVGDYAPCQAIGAAAHQLGLSGVIAPSASNLGETLALFTANLPVAHWPSVVGRDIWRGLPPDPRVLRVVDDEVG
jgi:RES domain